LARLCAVRCIEESGILTRRNVALVFSLLVLRLAQPAHAAEAPRRIISAAPSITEMLYDLGSGDRVVGVTSFCHYPPEVREKPEIGSYMYPNFETMLAMRPDLIVVLKEHGELIKKLQTFNLPVLELQHNDIAGIYDSMYALGRRLGVEETAAGRIEKIRLGLEAVRTKSAGRPKRSVLFIVGRTPGTINDLIVVGRGSFLNELIAIAGGVNIMAGSPGHYPKIPREELYARRPEVIIDMGDMSDTDGVSEEHRRSVVKLWDVIPILPAVKEKRVYAVADDIFVVPGPRVVLSAQELLKMIHPELAK
jgi:iron complex transport system substrate-binding protein